MLEAIYIGRRILTSGKIAHSFVTMAQIIECETAIAARPILKDFPNEVSELVDRKASFFKLKSTPGMIGGVYEVSEIADDRVTSISAHPTWLRASELPYIIAWRAIDQSAYNKSRAATLENKTEADPQFSKAVDVLRNRYQKIMPGDRIGFQVWLINQLVKK